MFKFRSFATAGNDVSRIRRSLSREPPPPAGEPLTLLLIAIGAVLGLLFSLLTMVFQPAKPAETARVGGRRSTASVLGRIVFRDPEAQAREFIGYYHSIKLKPEQEAIKKAALDPMPAVCCRRSTAYTCCCPCNLSKTVWGLSNVAISKYGANAKDVQQAVQSWLGYLNPASGFSGDACYRSGCDKAAHRGGCAGMEESKLDV